MFALPLLALVLTLAPVGGRTSAPLDATRTAFAVGIRGHAGQIVRLRATGIPVGYIASFCTKHVCAPFAVTLVLPSTGGETIELQLIANIAGAAAPKRVRVEAAGAQPISIDFRRGTRAD